MQLRTSYKVSLWVSLWISSVVLSFKQYFFLVPFASGFTLFGFIQALTVLGWIFLIVGPPIVLRGSGEFTQSRLVGLIFFGSFWTCTTVLIKIMELILYKQVWLDYMVEYPVFVVMEWIVPAYYLAVGLKSRKLNAV